MVFIRSHYCLDIARPGTAKKYENEIILRLPFGRVGSTSRRRNLVGIRFHIFQQA